MVNYSTRDKLKLKNVICNKCYKRADSWDDEIYIIWLRYLEGEDRNKIVNGTRYLSFHSLKYQFKKHPCYNKIANIRKYFKGVKTNVNGVNFLEYPWLLGLYFADGFIRNRSQLAFGLSMHEELIENKVFEELKQILGENAHIKRELIGNMRQIRTHSIELCDAFPKKNKDSFYNLWNQFSERDKMEFIGGLIDGDGSCSFDVGVNSVQIFSKFFPFMLEEFRDLLSKYGYVSLLKEGNCLYLSPKVGLAIKPYLVKRYIKRPYNGAVDVKRAFELLKQGVSVCKISKIMGFNKKTVNLALKQVYGMETIKSMFR